MDLKNIISLNKKFIFIILAVVGITFFSSYSYALFQVSVIKNNVIVLKSASNLDITTTIDDTNSDTFTLNGNGTRTITVHLDTDGITSAMAYKMYYEMTGYGLFTITSNETFTDNKIEGIMQPYLRANNKKITGKDISLTFTYTKAKNLTIKLGAIGGFEKTGASLTNQSELVSNTSLGIEPPPTPASEQLIDNYIDGATSGLVAITNDGSLCTSLCSGANVREYRYSGGETAVNNYITFNGEKWRIIGIFKGDTDDGANAWNIKIIREEALPALTTTSYTSTDQTNGGSFTLGTTSTYSIGAGQHSSAQPAYTAGRYYWNKGGKRSGYSDWAKAGLQFYLNEESNTKSWYYNTFKKSGAIGAAYEKYIARTTYKLGITLYNSNPPATAYTGERNTNSSNVWSNHAPTWSGKIALPYASDYGYAAIPTAWSTAMYSYQNVSNIKTNNWFLRNISDGYYWTIAPSTASSSNVLYWSYSGQVYSSGVSGNYFGIRPVLNLKSGTLLEEGGDGSYNNPYVISMT